MTIARSVFCIGLLSLLSIPQANAAEPPATDDAKYRAPPAFEKILHYVEAHGTATRLVRGAAIRYCDVPATDTGPCLFKTKPFEDETNFRSLLVLVDAERGETHVVVFHKIKATGEILAYGLTRDGQLRKALRVTPEKEYLARDLAEAEKDDSERGYKALIQFYVDREPDLRP